MEVLNTFLSSHKNCQPWQLPARPQQRRRVCSFPPKVALSSEKDCQYCSLLDYMLYANYKLYCPFLLGVSLNLQNKNKIR